jgi:hypothetical protein
MEEESGKALSSDCCASAFIILRQESLFAGRRLILPCIICVYVYVPIIDEGGIKEEKAVKCSNVRCLPLSTVRIMNVLWGTRYGFSQPAIVVPYPKALRGQVLVH